MTEVVLSYGKNSVIKNFQANGHADFSKKGNDIVCSAITILVRTAMQVLSQTENITFEADTSSRGRLAFSVIIENDLDFEKKIEIESRLKCVSDFLRNGISSLSEKYPQNVQMREI